MTEELHAMLCHPVQLYLDTLDEISINSESRLSSLLLAFEYLLRIDGLLLAAALINQKEYGDSSIWNLLLKSHMTLGEWRLLLKETTRVVRGPATQEIVQWFKSVDDEEGPLARLLQLRNQWAHAGNRTTKEFNENALFMAEPLFKQCLSTHPDLGEWREGVDGDVEVIQGRSRLQGGPFLLAGSQAGSPDVVLVFCGRARKALNYDSLQGTRFRSCSKFQEFTGHLRRVTGPMECIGALFPSEILHGRLLYHTQMTVERLTAQRRFRPECCIRRIEVDAKIASLLEGSKRLLLLEGPSGSGKTTWLCEMSESRRIGSRSVLLETADRLSTDRLPECLGAALRVRGNFSSALEDLASCSHDRRVLIAIDGLEITGREDIHLIELFQWIERLPAASCIRIVATIRSERLQSFRVERDSGIPLHLVEIFRIPPFSDRALVELAKQLPVSTEEERERIVSLRVDLARKITAIAYDSARLPGLATAILETAAHRSFSGSYSAHRIYEQYFGHLVGALGGRVERPLRGRILRTVSSALLAQMAYRIAIENRDIDPLHLIDFGTGRRSSDYESLLAMNVLSETPENFMQYISFVDLRFYEYIASLVLPLINVEELLLDLSKKSHRYPLALSVAAFLAIRVWQIYGSIETSDALKSLGKARVGVLLELARLDGEIFLDIIKEIAHSEASEALSLVVMLIRSGEPRLAERAAGLLINSATSSEALSKKARLIRAQAFFEIDDHRSAEKELNELEGEVVYEVLALRAEIAIVRGKLVTAHEVYRRLVEEAQETGDVSADRKADALGGLGYVLGRMGNYREAIAYLQNAIELLESHGSSSLLAEALGDLGQVFMDSGEFASSHDCLDRNFAICRELGDVIGEGVAESLMGELLFREERPKDAECRFLRALNVARVVGNRWREAWILKRLGRLCESLGRNEEAQDYFCESEELFGQIGGVDV